MPAAEEVTSLMENLTSQMRHRANQFPGPVLAQTSPNPAESWFGSGVRVEINGRYFVATAAHVVEDGRAVLPTHGLGQDDWDRVESIWAGQNPTLDVAWMEVTPGPAFRSEEWLPLDFIGLEAGLLERDLLVLLLGYPGEYWDLNQEARTLFSEAICFPSSTVSVVGADAGHLLSVDLPPGHELHGRGITSDEIPGNERVPLRGPGWSRVFRVLSQENDLLVPYPLDVVARGPDGTEVAVDVPKPDGLSGSGVWAFGANPGTTSWRPEHGRLVGILRTYAADGAHFLHPQDLARHSPCGVLYATRVEHALKLLANSVEELRPAIEVRLRQLAAT